MPDNAPHGFYVGNPRALRPETYEAATRAAAFVRKHFTANRGALLAVQGGR